MSLDDAFAAAAADSELAMILDDIEATLRRYVAFADRAQLVAVALWIVLTHVFDQFDTMPYLDVNSAEKRSGKSRTFDVIRMFVARPWAVITPSEAVVFRKIARDAPTVLIDEVDAIFSAKGTEHEGLRALLNAGNRKGVTVDRCAGEKQELRSFPVYCPKALAGIGKLPDTVADRSIPIRLQRRARTETVAKFRQRDAEAAARPIRERLEEWAADVDVSHLRPAVPEQLNDRAADAWEPMLAVADVAGGHWSQRARHAAVRLHSTPDAEDESLGVQLLADLRDAFGTRDRVAFEDLVETLTSDAERPWGDLRGKPLDVRALARLLRPYGVRPTQLRIGDGKVRGYTRDALVDVWERYAPLHTVTGSEPVPPNRDSEAVQRYTAGQSSKTTDPAVEASEPKSASDQGRTGVPAENPVQAVPDAGASTQSDVDYGQALDLLTREFDPVEIIRRDMPSAHVTGGDAA